MKVKHRVPARPTVTDEVTPEYQAEVDRTMARAERAHREAERRLVAAERAAEEAARAATRQPTRRTRMAAQQAWDIVELRRMELLNLQVLVTASQYGSRHRGVKSHGPVPSGSVL